jgi:hypothetical protein
MVRGLVAALLLAFWGCMAAADHPDPLAAGFIDSTSVQAADRPAEPATGWSRSPEPGVSPSDRRTADQHAGVVSAAVRHHVVVAPGPLTTRPGASPAPRSFPRNESLRI